MATKFTPKKNKVTGTKKNDKITWVNSKAWKKALTVNAGTGNDVIDYRKSKYNNILNGQNGDDKIYGGSGKDKITGGKGNDQINAGKGNNIIYFNKGDGKDTVLNGGGIDTLVFAKETAKTLKAKISGKNIILTGKNGKNTVTLKNFMNGNHSAQYVQIGKKKVKTENLIAVKNIKSASTSVKGTNLRDKITSTADNAVINALAGDDTINISGNNFTINTGKGNDVINLSGNAKGTVEVNKGSGNLVINGIENAINNISTQYTDYAVILKADSLIQEFHSIYYVAGKQVGNNLVVYLNSGETVTITDYYKIDNENRGKALGINCSIEDISKYGDISTYDTYMAMFSLAKALPAEFILNDPDNNIDMGNRTYISIEKDNVNLYVSGNLDRTIEYKSSSGKINIEDTAVHNINISNVDLSQGAFCGTNIISINNAMLSTFSFKEGSVNNVNIDYAFMSYFYFEEGSINNVILDNNIQSSEIYFNGNSNIVNSLAKSVAINFDSKDLSKQNILYSNGDSEFIYNAGNTLIDFSVDDNHHHKQIYVQNENAITEIKNPEKVDMTIYNDYQKGSLEIVLIHNYNANANETTEGDDFITLRALNENGNFTSGETKIWGKWIAGNDDKKHFNLEALNKDYFSVRKGYTGAFVGISGGLTQYVDMAELSNNMTFDSTSGVLNMAKDVLINGTTNNDTYTVNSITNLNKQYTIAEQGGSNDTLIISQDKSNFRFFFDVKKNGNFGDDLYIISTTGGNNSEFHKFITNQDSNFICIKDGKRLSSAEMDIIRTTTQEISDYGALCYISDIKASVANWLNTYNAANSKNYGTIMEAIQAGAGNDDLYNLYTSGASTTAWNNYWNNL